MSTTLQTNRQPKHGDLWRTGERVQTSVVNWFRCDGRGFPWQDTTKPFNFFITETLLHQTQVTRVATLYIHIHLVTTYPHPASLTEDGGVGFRQWFKPLSLILRAVKLVEYAYRVLRNYDKNIPRDLQSLESLLGIERNSMTDSVHSLQHSQPMIGEKSGRLLWRILRNSCTGPAYAVVRVAESMERLILVSPAPEFNLELISIGASHCHPITPECPLWGDCIVGPLTKHQYPRDRRLSISGSSTCKNRPHLLKRAYTSKRQLIL